MSIGSTEEAGGFVTQMDDLRRRGGLVSAVTVVCVGKILSDGRLNNTRLSLSSFIRRTPLSDAKGNFWRRVHLSEGHCPVM